MEVLQLCNGFLGSKVHYNLFAALDTIGTNQIILSYVRPNTKKEQNPIETEHTHTIIADIIRPIHHYLYHLKIHALYRDLCNRIDVKDISLVHASTMFSDGGVAYLLWRKYKIPYIVAVRNTDVNSYLNNKKAFFTWYLGRKILLHASKIVFISPAYKEQVATHKTIASILQQIKNKFVVIPNGVDDFWLNNKVSQIKNNHHICYVGDFSPNKNVVRLIEAVLSLKTYISDIHLDIIGGGTRSSKIHGDDTEKIKPLIKQNQDIITFHGKIYNKDRQKEIYSTNSVFAMPSIHETFGLVYIEALSQNLRLLYSKGQGVDGVFKEKTGEAVNPFSVDSIRTSLINLLLNPTDYSTNIYIDMERFRWSNIALMYKELYKDM